MLRRTFLSSSAGLAGTFVLRQPERAVRVRSLAELQAAIDQVGAGDRIELDSGTYATESAVRIAGTQGQPGAPVTIAAARVGRTEITGPYGFDIEDSAYVVLAGFRFTHAAPHRVPATSHHLRFTRNHFELPAEEGDHWLNIDGDDCEVDHNTFTNRFNLGVWVSISGPDGGIAQRTRVHHNHFLNHRFDGANGGEPIRLGLSHKQSYSAFAVIEYNLFEKADGDPEAVSVKSRDNVIRYNTIVDSIGSIVLRHGHRNRVEGNLMLGGRSGIRFYGKDHVIVNNLVAGSTGTGLVIGSGNVEEDHDSTGNEQVDRVLMAFNTLVGNATSVGGEGQRPLGPRDCVIANNIVAGAGAQLVTMPQGAAGFRWEGNILHGAPAGDIPAEGYSAVDPLLEEDPHGIFRISRRSPAVDAAVGSYPEVTLDVDLRHRRGRKDVGADELTWPPGPRRRPLTRADVGPYA
jgi:hypothetical protein